MTNDEKRTRVVLADGTQIEGLGGLENMIVMCKTQEEAQDLWDKWNDQNLAGATVDDAPTKDLVKMNDYRFIDKRGNGFRLILQAREQTREEKRIAANERLVSKVIGSEGAPEDREAAALQTRRFMQLQVQAANLPDDQAMEVADLYEEWMPDKRYLADKIIKWGKNVDGETQLYRVIQDHTSQDGWEPDNAASLFKAIGFTEEGISIWTQPLGGHDAYEKGDEVSHVGKIWVSDLDGNVWEPGVYGWTEKAGQN